MGIKTIIKQSTVLSVALTLLLVLLMPDLAQTASIQTVHLPASGAPEDVFDESQECAIFSDILQAMDAAEDAQDWDTYGQLSELYGTLCPNNGLNMDAHTGMGSALTPLGLFANPVIESDGQNSATYAGLYQLANINQIPVDATICSVKSVLNFTPTEDGDFNNNDDYTTWSEYPGLPQGTDPNITAPNSDIGGVKEYPGGEQTGTDFGMSIYDGTNRIPGVATGPVVMVPGTGNTVVVGAYNQPAVGSERSVTITPTTLPTRTQLASWKIGVLLQQDSYGPDRFSNDYEKIPTHWIWDEEDGGWEADQFSPSPQSGKTDTVTLNKFGADVTYSTNGGCDEQPANSISVDSPTNTDGTTTTPVTINTPTGTSITCSSGLNEATQSTKDASFQYPLGLVQFCFDTPNQNNTVNLAYITDLKPQDVVARKYNPNNNSYFNIENATITQTTIDNQPALSLTYTITDNGDLDLDLDPTLGKITDPVGLATLTTASPNTGLGKYWLLGLK
jgi:hypothetical protein